MNVAVIGSGATAYGVLLKLKEFSTEKNIKVTIFSKNLNYMNEVFLENKENPKQNSNSNFAKNSYSKIRHNFGHTCEQIKINNSRNLIYNITNSGGLSDMWSGSAALALNQDLKNWGLKSDDIDKYYKIIVDKLPLSGEKNDFVFTNKNSEVYPLNLINSPPIKKHTLVKKLISKFKENSNNINFQVGTNNVFVDTNLNSKNICTNTQSCFSGCIKDSFFRPSKKISEWIDKKFFNYHNDLVDKINSKNNQYEVVTSNKKNLFFDKVFLCAGAYNSAKIIINSFGYPNSKVNLYDIPIKHFPIISLIPSINIEKNTFGFSSASGGITLNEDSYYHLLFGQIPEEYFRSKFGKNIFSKVLKNFFGTFCLFSSIYGRNKDFLSYELTKNFELNFLDHNKLKEINKSLENAIEELKKILFKKKFLVLNRFSINGESSSHYSSNLFEAYKIDHKNKGQFDKNLYVCDSSTLGYGSSSQPHTFFLMANAYRLTTNVLSNI